MTPIEMLETGQEDGYQWLLDQVDHDTALILNILGLAKTNLTDWQSLYPSSYQRGQIAYYQHVIDLLTPLALPPPPPPIVVPQTKPYTGPLFEQLTPLQAWYKALPQGYKPPPPQEAPPLVTIPPPVQEILSRASRILVT